MKALLAALVIGIASLTGCTTVAPVFMGPGAATMNADTLTLDKQVKPKRFVDVATETGKAMGYTVTTSIQNYGSDGLVATATMTKGGKKSLFDAWHITLTATLGVDGKTVTLNPLVIGDPPDRTSLVGTMKQALAAKLGT